MLISATELPGPPGGHSFVGADHGGVPICLFLVDVPPRSGPELHRHPYAEIFVIDSGHADFQVGDSRLTAHAGDILIAPAGSAHRFTSTGEHQLRLTAIHAASTMETEWLTADPKQMPASSPASGDRRRTADHRNPTRPPARQER